MNLHHLTAAFLAYGASQLGYSPHTVKGYGCTLRRFARWANAEGRDGRFGLDNLRTYLTEREREGCLRPRSVRILLGGLRAFGAWLVETGVLSENPCRQIKRTPLDAAIVQGTTESEALALLDGCRRLRGDPNRAILAKAVLSTFLFSGVRCAELLALEVEDVNLLDRRLLVRRGKGGKTRSIPLSADLRTALAAWLAIRRAPACVPNLFLSTIASGMRDWTLRRLLRDVQIAAGLRDCDHLKPHSFRRYFATHLQRNGVSLATIGRLLGHSSPAITCLYLLSSAAEMEDAVELATPRKPEIRIVPGGKKVVPAGPRKSSWRRAG